MMVEPKTQTNADAIADAMLQQAAALVREATKLDGATFVADANGATAWQGGDVVVWSTTNESEAAEPEMLLAAAAGLAREGMRELDGRVGFSVTNDVANLWRDGEVVWSTRLENVRPSD